MFRIFHMEFPQKHNHFDKLIVFFPSIVENFGQTDTQFIILLQQMTYIAENLHKNSEFLFHNSKQFLNS